MNNNGTTVTLQARSYRAAQERQRVAEALLKAEVEHSECVRAWANKAFDEMREQEKRCTYLYGLAARLGASYEELSGAVSEGTPQSKGNNK